METCLFHCLLVALFSDRAQYPQHLPATNIWSSACSSCPWPFHRARLCSCFPVEIWNTSIKSAWIYTGLNEGKNYKTVALIRDNECKQASISGSSMHITKVVFVRFWKLSEFCCYIDVFFTVAYIWKHRSAGSYNKYQQNIFSIAVVSS